MRSSIRFLLCGKPSAVSHLLFFAFSLLLPAFAASPVAPQYQDSVSVINFKQGFAIDSNKIISSPELISFANLVDSICRNEKVEFVKITGLSSIDGPVGYNNRLALARAKSMMSWLTNNTSLTPNVFKLAAKGEDWGLFEKLVKKNKSIPNWQQVVDIIQSKESDNDKEYRLRRLDNGIVWKYLAEHTFPKMRTVEISLGANHRFLIMNDEPQEETPEPEVVEEVVVEVIETPVEEPQPAEEVITEPEPAPVMLAEDWQRKFRIGTDLPYWVMLWSNLSFEIDLAKHWSFNLPVYFSAMNYFKHTLKFRVFGFQPGIRYWLKETNRGVYFDAHYGMAWWDFAFDGKYRYQDEGRHSPLLGGGLAAGYRLPISKNGRWSMDFGAGVGVYHIRYDRFQNKYNGKRIDSKSKTVFFPDNLNVSIIYNIPVK